MKDFYTKISSFELCSQILTDFHSDPFTRKALEEIQRGWLCQPPNYEAL